MESSGHHGAYEVLGPGPRAACADETRLGLLEVGGAKTGSPGCVVIDMAERTVTPAGLDHSGGRSTASRAGSETDDSGPAQDDGVTAGVY